MRLVFASTTADHGGAEPAVTSLSVRLPKGSYLNCCPQLGDDAGKQADCAVEAPAAQIMRFSESYAKVTCSPLVLSTCVVILPLFWPAAGYTYVKLPIDVIWPMLL